MSSSVIRFIKLNKNKKLTLGIWYLSAFYRAQMLLIPAKKLEKNWGQKGMESPESDTKEHYWYCRRVCLEVNRICNKTPWESKCLVKAQTARFLLRRKGIKTTLYLGVGKDENGQMVAHSWLRCGEVFVTGGNGNGYGTVAKFVM